MAKTDYKNIFKKDHWGTFGSSVMELLNNESVLVTAIPAGGKRYFLRHIKTYYYDFNKDPDTVIISFELTPDLVSINKVSQKIYEILSYKLQNPKYLEGLSCEEAIEEVISRSKRILFIINRLEWLKKHPETMIFLESLRIIDQLHIRFLIGCDISVLINPEQYQAAGILASSNVFVIPPFNTRKIELSIDIHNQIYHWKVDKKYTRRIKQLSGGNQGLTKYLFKYIHTNKGKDFSSQKLLGDPGIRLKIVNIYEQLKGNNLIKDNELNMSQTHILINLNILNAEINPTIQLLEQYLSTIRIELGSDRIEKLLSSQELILFRYLVENEEDIVSLEKIAQLVWGKYATKKYSLWALYKVISNLNKKIKKYGYRIENFKGRGYSLTKRALT